MVSAADVTAEDLVDSLLNSISTGSSASASSSKAFSSQTSSSSSSSSSSATDGSVANNAVVHPRPTATTSAPASTKFIPSPTTSAPSTSVRGTSGSEDNTSSGSGVAMGIGLAVAALVMIACVLLYLRRRKRIKTSKARREQFGGVDELGPPQPSIELPVPQRPLYRPSQDPGVRGSSMYSSGSSAHEGGASSVFNTVGALSPTSRKFGASNYQFRASSISSVSSSSSNVQTADGSVHVVGAHSSLMAPSGSGRKLARVLSGREMDEADEDAQYEQLHSTSAATSTPLGGDFSSDSSRPSNVSAVNSLHDSMSSDVFHHGDGLGRAKQQQQQQDAAPAPSVPTPAQERNDAQLAQVLDSSLISGRTKRTGSVYDSIPALAGEQMYADASSTPSEPATAPAPAPATGRRAPPPPPPAGVPAFQPVAEGSSYVAPLPTSLSSFASADDLEFALDAPPSTLDRESNVSTASASSSDSASTRGGSLIALAETTHENGHEIAI